MDVFITWSGTASLTVAEALKRFLPRVMQAVHPFLSTQDIRSGQRWGSVIARRLESSQFGIICLTPENTTAPWVLFEAGALSKNVEQGHVVPFLLGLEPVDLTGPLAEFQGKKPTRDHLFDVVKDMNTALGEGRAVPPEILEEAFEQHWPGLEQAVRTAVQQLQDQGVRRTERTSEEILEEVVEATRGQRETLRLVLDALAQSATQLKSLSTFVQSTSTRYIPAQRISGEALQDLAGFVQPLRSVLSDEANPIAERDDE